MSIEGEAPIEETLTSLVGLARDETQSRTVKSRAHDA